MAVCRFALTLPADILRQDWMPVLNLGSVAFGLMTLFLEPNPDDPLNKGTVQCAFVN
jgi:ubiquitin-protein ligase